MTTGSKTRQVLERERDLLDFTRSYLSEAFPNPERKGCPPDDLLKTLASEPKQGEKTISAHLTCCSPCFNAYMAHLAHARAEAVQSHRIRRVIWIRRSLVAAGVCLVLMAAAYLFLTRWNRGPIVAPRTPAPSGNPGSPAQSPLAATYVPVLLDLSNASPARGPGESEPNPAPQVIPSTLINLTLQLPIGSEARGYSVMLRSNRRAVWKDSAQAHLENGEMLLHMKTDFSHMPIGQYDLSVVSKSFRLSVPVVVKITPHGRTQQGK